MLNQSAQEAIAKAAQQYLEDEDIGKERANALVFLTKRDFWQSAARYHLLKRSHTASDITFRLGAATALLKMLHMHADDRYLELAALMRHRLFLTCQGFEECYQLVTALAETTHVFATFFETSDYQAVIRANFGKIEDPFFRNILEFRFQSVLINAKFLNRSGLAYYENFGKAPRLADHELAELRAMIDENIGENGFWEQSLKTLRERYQQDRKKNSQDNNQGDGDRENELTDYELMVYELSNHFVLEIRNLRKFAKFDESGILAEMWKKRARLMKKSILDRGDATERALVSSIPTRMVQALFLSYRNILGFRYYLKRVELQDAEEFLEVINLALNVGLFKQDSFDPIAGFFALVYFSKFEFALPTRRDWFTTTLRYIKAMAEYAKLQSQSSAPKETSSPHDFISSTQFLIGQSELVESQYDFYASIIDGFIQKQNLKQFWGNQYGLTNKGTYEIEKWVAEHLPHFHSLFYQFLQISSSELPYIAALSEAVHAKGDYTREEIQLKKLEPRWEQHLLNVLSSACYGYWYPIDAEGYALSPKEINRLTTEEMIDQKPEWQTTYQFKADQEGQRMSDEVYDLKRYCGSNPKNVRREVQKYLNYERSKHLPDSYAAAFGQKALRLSGDVLFTIGAAKATGVLSQWGRFRSISNRITMKLIGNRLTRGALALAGNTVGGHLKRFSFRTTRHLLLSSLNLSAFIVARRALEQGTLSLQGLSDNKILHLFPGRKFVEWDSKQEDESYAWNITRNLYENFGMELVLGLPVIVALPMTEVFAHRQVYHRSILGRSKPRATALEIEDYVAFRGTRRLVKQGRHYTYQYKPGGYGMVEELGYVGLPMVYQTALFAGVPYVYRYLGQQFFESQDNVWQGWSVFIEDDLATSIAYAGAFGVWHMHSHYRIRRDYYRHANERIRHNKAEELDYEMTTPARFKHYHILDLKPRTFDPTSPRSSWRNFGMRPREYSKAELKRHAEQSSERNIPLEQRRQAYETLADLQKKKLYDHEQQSNPSREFGATGFITDLEILFNYFSKRGLPERSVFSD